MELEQEILAPPARIERPSTRPVKVIRPPSFSPAVLISGLVELIWYRDLLYTLTLHRIRVRYKQSVLGLGWALVQPLAMMMVYTIIFSIFARFPSKGLPYSLFVLCGILPWNFFQTALSSSATGLVSHTSLITKVYFPREILPFSYVMAAFFDFLVACVILVAMMAWYHVGLTLQALYVIPILAVEVIFISGIGLLFSAFQVRFRDIGIAMPLILQLWMFCAPVVYSYSDVPKRFRTLYMLDPMAGIVENFRRVIVQGWGADLRLLGVSAVAALILLPIGYMYFKHREATMADVI
jgi:homopolymeric O-antigen transport system permease protein